MSIRLSAALLSGCVLFAQPQKPVSEQAPPEVDAALRARSAALDHMSAAATFLETTGTAQQQAQALATARWADFNNEARISWRNLSDPTHGEHAVIRE